MNVVYRPVRLINREVIDTFRCVPVVKNPDSTTTVGKHLLTHDKNILLTATRNAALLKNAFAELTKTFAAGKRCRMIVPINSYSVASKEGATLIVKTIRELDKPLCEAVIAELIDLPKSLNLDMLGDMTVPFLPFFDKYLAEPRGMSEAEDFTLYSNCNYFGVSMDLEGLGTDESAIARMTQFWAEAVKCRLKVVFQGVGNQAALDKAKQYEAFALDGPVIGADKEILL